MKKETMFEDLKKDYIERKIFLKRQLIELTEKEIAVMEKEILGHVPANTIGDAHHDNS